jgi:hypothetical protein
MLKNGLRETIKFVIMYRKTHSIYRVHTAYQQFKAFTGNLGTLPPWKGDTGLLVTEELMEKKRKL